jgi:hypothetical protein
MEDTPERESTEAGAGILDLRKIYDHKEMAGMEYFFVEQESFKIDPFESIARSFLYLKNL